MSDLYARLGIDFDQLGCVMLDCEPTTFLQDLVPPTFATVKGMFLDNTDPLATLDGLTILFSDNWFDSNFGYYDAHRRLSRLPHIDTYEYKAHVTVGHVIKGAGKYLLPDLELALSEHRTPLQLVHTGLNYGRAEGEAS